MRPLARAGDYAGLPDRSRGRIRRYLENCASNVEYYHNTFKGARLRVEDLHKLPIVTSRELASAPSAFVASPEQVVQVCSSGGTGGRPKMLFRTRKDLESSVRVTERMFGVCGIESSDRVVILQPFDIWNIGHLALRALIAIGARSFPLGISCTNDQVLDTILENDCNVLYSSPSRAVDLVVLSQERSRNGAPIQKVLCAGEPVLPQHRARIFEGWGAQVYSVYGSEETDGIGVECSASEGFHLVNDDLLLEVLDPNALTPAEQDEGAAAYTLLGNTGTVLVRYVLGDIVRLVPGECSCGSAYPRIAIIGRLGQSLHLYDGITVPLSEIEYAIRDALGTDKPFQVMLSHQPGRDRIGLHVVSREEAGPARSRILASLLASNRELNRAYTYEKKVEVDVTLHDDPSGLKQTRRGKTPRLIDERSYGGSHQDR